jgi:hypothetical protein
MSTSTSRAGSRGVVLPDDAERFAGLYSGKDVVRIYGEDGAARWKALRGG